jgi:predicted MFS family arabinose efflux permease
VDVKRDVIDVRTYVFDVKTHVIDVKRDLIDMTRDVIDVKRDVFIVKRDVIDVTTYVIDVKRDVIDVKRDVIATAPSLLLANQLGGISPSNLAVVNSLNSLERALFMIPLTKAGMAYGRRPAILITHFVTFLAFLLLSISFQFPTILAGSVLLGCVANTPRAIGRLALGDLSNPSNMKSSFNKTSSMSVVGMLFGVLLAGLCASVYGHQVAMIVQAGIAALALVHALSEFPETLSPLTSVSEQLDFMQALTLPIVWVLVASMGVTVISQGMLYQVSRPSSA